MQQSTAENTAKPFYVIWEPLRVGEKVVSASMVDDSAAAIGMARACTALGTSQLPQAQSSPSGWAPRWQLSTEFY